MDDQTKLLTEIRDLLRSQQYEQFALQKRVTGLKYSIGGLLLLMTMCAVVFGAYRAGYLAGQRDVQKAAQTY